MPVPAIRLMHGDESRACEQVLRRLPDWFGIEVALLQYVRDVASLPTWIAADGDRVIGFLTFRRHFASAAEVHCMAVDPDYHRTGVGRRLLAAVEAVLHADGVEYLQVKTLGPSRPSAHYAMTRRFYEAVGFAPMEEFANLWEGIPCLMLVKRLERGAV